MFECEMAGCDESAMQDITTRDSEGVTEFQICDDCRDFLKTQQDIEILKIERYNSTWTGDAHD